MPSSSASAERMAWNDSEGLRLTPRPIEREHLQRPQLLPVRVLAGDALDLDGDGEVVSERQPGAEHGLDRHQPELLEPGRIGLQGRLIREVLERTGPATGPAPPRARRRPWRDPGSSRARASLTRASKSRAVQAVAIDPDGVAARVALDDLAERLAKLRHVRLEGVAGGVRRRLPPHPVDQPVDRHRRVGFGEEQGEDEPLLRTAQSRLAARQGRRPRRPAPAPRPASGPSTSNLTAPS